MINKKFNDMGHKEPSYKSSWGKVDWLDEHEYSCLAVQGQSLDPEQYIYQWSILVVGSFCGPNFCNNCRWTGFGPWKLYISMVPDGPFFGPHFCYTFNPRYPQSC